MFVGSRVIFSLPNTLNADINNTTSALLDSFNVRQRKLAANLLLLQLVITSGYFIFIFFFSFPFTKYFLPSLVISTLMAFFLWKTKKYRSAIVFDLVALNILLFFISERMPIGSGVDLYYVAVGSATLALFGYEYWRAGIGFSLLSLVLFLTSRLFEFPQIPLRDFSEFQQETFFIINSILASGISIYCIITVMKTHHDDQRKLQQVKDTIETQNHELIKINEELDRFVYSASHDLRSPLSSMKGLVNVFEMDPNARKEEYLPKIKSRIQTMDKFIGEITDYSRNTRVQVTMEFVLLKPLVEEIASSLRYIDKEERLVFEIDIKDDFVLRSDVYRLKIILNNLISNAIKYADFEKEKPLVAIKAEKKVDIVRIQITDNGIGVRKEMQDKIFNMFFRATEKSTGSGLGLYIVNESVKKLNGKIELESEVNVGSTFTLVLPQ